MRGSGVGWFEECRIGYGQVLILMSRGERGVGEVCGWSGQSVAKCSKEFGGWVVGWQCSLCLA